MICKNCPIIEVCKTFEFINNQHHAEITVTACKYNDKDNISLDDQKFDYSKQTNTMPVKNYQGQIKPDLRDVEKQVLNIPDEPEHTIVNCPTCKGETYDDDIRICTKCGKPVCSNCGTAVDLDLLCEDCWKALGKE